MGYTVHGFAKSWIPSKFFQHEINQPQCGMSLRPPNANLCPSVPGIRFYPEWFWAGGEGRGLTICPMKRRKGSE